jgi:hypothetical protein
VILTLILGCTDPVEGTAVGNPGSFGIDLDPPQDAELSRATAEVDAIALDDCDGGVVDVPAGEQVDALGAEHPFVLPAGAWCGVSVDASYTIEGTTTAGTAFTVDLAPPTFEDADPFTVDGDVLLLRIDADGFFDVAAIDARGPDVVVADDDPLATQWADELGSSATVGVRVTDTDQPAGYDGQSAACGCDGSGGRGGWGVLAAFALAAITRNRRHPGR